jgi:putative membrane protein
MSPAPQSGDSGAAVPAGNMDAVTAGRHRPLAYGQAAADAAPAAPKSSNELAQARTALASQRTLMAADRSLMAWVRTGLSMISFGFTIYKILEGFQRSGADVVQTHTPRSVGLFLTGMGTLAIVIGTIEYWERRRSYLAFGDVKLWRPAFVMALLVSAAGMSLFVGIIWRLL